MAGKVKKKLCPRFDDCLKVVGLREKGHEDPVFALLARDVCHICEKRAENK